MASNFDFLAKYWPDMAQIGKLAELIEENKANTKKIVYEMKKKLQKSNRGIDIIELDDSFQMCTKTDMYEYLIKIAKSPRKYVLTDSVLESITRDTIIRLAKEELGLEVKERTIDRTELYLADEAFLCGSAMEITPIYTIDRYKVGTGEQGKVTKELHLTYLDCVRGKLGSKKEWLTVVY